MSDEAVPHGTPTELFIDGAWTPGGRGTFEVINPATATPLARVADASVADGRMALDAAVKAGESWARTPARERAEILRRAFELTTARGEELARLMTLEMGKPLDQARGEVTYGAEFLRWFSEVTAHVSGRYRPAPEGNARHLMVKRPVGPCLLITPWNFPLAMATRKIAPALAAGCTVVLRPAHLTPLTSLAFTQILADAGVPAGVVNVITSTRHDVTDALIADPRLRKLSFTGSTRVGVTLLKQAADNVLRTSMELGGNAPFLVFDDADLDAAVEGAYVAKLRNMGEACTAANRFLVQEGVADEFARRLADRFAGLSVGDGLQPGVDVGPMITGEARGGVAALVEQAVSDGAELLTGGVMPADAGYFYPPTVLADVPADAALQDQEIFGPVAPVTRFSDEAQAVTLANSVEVGLAAYVFTADLRRALRMSESIEAGLIAINAGVLSNAAAPFGGVKHSGLGREGAEEGIEEYLETVYVNLPDPFAGRA